MPAGMSGSLTFPGQLWSLCHLFLCWCSLQVHQGGAAEPPGRLARINTPLQKTTRLELLKQERGLVPRVSNGLEEGLPAISKGQDGAVVSGVLDCFQR